LIAEAMEEGIDALDALLDYLQICRQQAENDDKIVWSRKRPVSGWLVPVVVGYKAISPLAKVKSQRDPDCLHCFAENVITLGEFVMPIRFQSIEEFLWYPEIDEDKGFYIYQQKKSQKEEY